MRNAVFHEYRVPDETGNVEAVACGGALAGEIRFDKQGRFDIEAIPRQPCVRRGGALEARQTAVNFHQQLACGSVGAVVFPAGNQIEHWFFALKQGGFLFDQTREQPLKQCNVFFNLWAAVVLVRVLNELSSGVVAASNWTANMKFEDSPDRLGAEVHHRTGKVRVQVETGPRPRKSTTELGLRPSRRRPSPIWRFATPGEKKPVALCIVVCPTPTRVLGSNALITI